jgi:hypothetical protein
LLFLFFPWNFVVSHFISYIQIKIPCVSLKYESFSVNIRLTSDRIRLLRQTMLRFIIVV